MQNSSWLVKPLFAASALVLGALAAQPGLALELKSPTFKDGDTLTNEQVFNSFGCSGKNVSPAFEWSGTPEGTKAFALTLYDPDAPTGSGWWHWLVVNIPADAKGLPAKAGNSGGKLPKGAMQTRTDFGKPGYGGPCPPPGDKPHRYVFKLFALKDKLPLKSDAPGAMAGFYINGNKLAEASMTATFGR